MWASVLGLDLSACAQTLGGVDDHPAEPAGHRKAYGERRRRELLCVAARVVSHARRVVIRPTPTALAGPLPVAWPRLTALPTRPHATAAT